MIASNLPSPGTIATGLRLRQLAASAISQAELRKDRGGSSPELKAFFTACAAAVDAPSAPVLTGLTVTPASSSKAAGSTTQLAVAATPSGATLPALTYTSSDPTKATVNASGLITFVAAGTSTVTVSGGGFSGTCAVTVTA